MALHATDDVYAKIAVEKLMATAGSATQCHLAPSVKDAELILVVAAPHGDQLLHKVRRDPVYRLYREKCVVVSEADNPITLLPGIYAGTARRWLSDGWVASGPYIQKLRASELADDGINQPIKHLYSFVGSTYTHPVRERLLRLEDARALIRDAGGKAIANLVQQPAHNAALLERQRSYDLTLARSAFVICPRGRSPASIRFFETLRTGRVPVVLADEWALPNGPDWEKFVIRVPESQVDRLPQLLRHHESEAMERGRLARQAWDEWFCDEVLLDRLVELAWMIQHARCDTWLRRLWRYRISASRDHLRDTVRGWRRVFLSRGVA